MPAPGDGLGAAHFEVEVVQTIPVDAMAQDKIARTGAIRRARGPHSIMALLLASATLCEALPAPPGKRDLIRALRHAQRGEALYMEGKVDRAIAEYRRALKIDAEEPYWHRGLAKAYERRGEPQAALDEYRIASEQSPLDSGLRSKYEELADKLEISMVKKRVNAPLAGAKVFSLGRGDSGPIAVYMPETPYSERARKVRLHGSTVLLIVVDVGGNVTDTRVVRPLGLGLDERALETIRTWKFRPALRNSRPISVQVRVDVSF